MLRSVKLEEFWQPEHFCLYSGTSFIVANRGPLSGSPVRWRAVDSGPPLSTVEACRSERACHVSKTVFLSLLRFTEAGQELGPKKVLLPLVPYSTHTLILGCSELWYRLMQI